MVTSVANGVGLAAKLVASELRTQLQEAGVSAEVKAVSRKVVEIHTSGFKGMFEGKIRKKIEKGLRSKGVEASITVV